MGIANETLIVFVGDHGQAFQEDAPIMGNFENKHVSNFRVPIVFRHPQLPRVQVNANATSISILPTILDLLVHTGSLNDRDGRIASDLVQDYEGQSLIRPYVSSKNGRRAWNFGIVNAGGGMISITSADTPWKLDLPLEREVDYSFTDLAIDTLELNPTEAWEFKDLVHKVRSRYGEGAAEWANEAEKVINYFVYRQQRLWKYAP
jgi:arylsulfatase A-like enzyme